MGEGETPVLTTDGADVDAIASAFGAWAAEGVRVMCLDALGRPGADGAPRDA